ncbi:MAG: sulfatase-like hydrolase/transferase, partial [Planctomycetia bacterium]|nr:sulfatase-like hydrolase/transferase [Planctomycetia bacterium]
RKFFKNDIFVSRTVKFLIMFLVMFLVAGFSIVGAAEGESTPNVVVILADDLGFGDLSCFGANAIETPHIDQLAQSGIRFTRGYATSATCTPSRYALLTGMYPIRHPNASILPGDAPMIIRPESLTLPQLFKNAGYATGFVGKWHLGLGEGKINWNEKIQPGILDVGFDYSFHMAATNDRTPTVYLENDRVANLDPNDPLFVDYRRNFEGEPTYQTHPQLVTKQKSLQGHNNSLHNGIGRIGFQKGGVAARWVDETMAATFAEKSERFIRGAVAQKQPFFLYYALHQPHVPRMPDARFAGKSTLGLRGDVILEMDWQVGELLRLLEELGIRENTIVIFTSDNGPVLNDGYAEEAVARNNRAGHTPSGILRGGKYSRYEGGTHVPFIVSWPGSVQPGESDAIVCQIDFLASFASMLRQPMSEPTDSEDYLDALLGKSSVGRAELLLESSRRLSFRTEKWFLVPNVKKGAAELFDLENDPAQKTDVAEKYPDVVEELSSKMNAILKK